MYSDNPGVEQQSEFLEDPLTDDDEDEEEPIFSGNDVPEEGNYDPDNRINSSYTTEGNAVYSELPNNIPTVDELRNESNLSVDILLSYMQEYEYQVNGLREEIQKIKYTHKKNIKQSRGSIVELHNKMFKKLLEAESEQEQKIEEYEDVIHDLRVQLGNTDTNTNTDINTDDGNNNDNDNDNDNNNHNNNSDTGNAAQKRGSFANFTSDQFQQLVDQETGFNEKTKKLQKRIKELEDELSIEKMQTEEMGHSHRQSITTLHTNMFKKLLEAEDEHDVELQDLKEHNNAMEQSIRKRQLMNENAERLRRGSIEDSELYDSMVEKLLVSEKLNEDQKVESDEKVKQLRHELRYERLKNEQLIDEKHKLKNMNNKQNNNNSNNSNGNSDANTTHRMSDSKFESLWNDADGLDNDNDDDNDNDNSNGIGAVPVSADAQGQIARMTARIKELEVLVRSEKANAVVVEKTRQNSIHNLHNNMFQKLLDAEFEYEEEIEKIEREKEELLEKIEWLQDTINNRLPQQSSSSITDDGSGDHSQSNDGGEHSNQNQNHRHNMMANNSNEKGLLEKNAKIEELLITISDNEETIMDLRTRVKTETKKSETIDKHRRDSLTNVSANMFGKLLEVQKQMSDMKDEYELKVSDLEQQLSLEQLRNEASDIPHTIKQSEIQELAFTIEELKLEKTNIEKKRRESFSNLKESMYQQLVSAEQKQEVSMKKLNIKYNQLKSDNNFLIVSKCNLIEECNLQMNFLKKALIAYQQQIHHYQEIQNKSWLFG